VIADLARFDALVIGNGLGIAEATMDEIRQVVAAATGRGVPTVVDADGLTALGTEVSRFVSETTVLTPHDGEFARLTGRSPSEDRIADARALAAESGAIVLLKGRTTVVAAPDGEVLVSIAGDQRLATAGTGDVLAGIIGALLACGVDPLHAAAGGAFIHGRAGALGWRRGLVAGDVIAHLPAVLDDLTFLRP
jgi:NAD(P)H-hydrate epimerase